MYCSGCLEILPTHKSPSVSLEDHRLCPSHRSVHRPSVTGCNFRLVKEQQTSLYGSSKKKKRYLYSFVFWSVHPSRPLNLPVFVEMDV